MKIMDATSTIRAKTSSIFSTLRTILDLRDSTSFNEHAPTMSYSLFRRRCLFARALPVQQTAHSAGMSARQHGKGARYRRATVPVEGVQAIALIVLQAGQHIHMSQYRAAAAARDCL